MPIYDYVCCEGHRFERMVPLALFRQAQACECGAPSQKQISAPRIVKDTIEPIYGADGKLHDSLSSYRKSLLPEGNPKGERYTEIGNEPMPEPEAYKPDQAAMVDSIKQAIADVDNGRVAQCVTGDN